MYDKIHCKLKKKKEKRFNSLLKSRERYIPSVIICWIVKIQVHVKSGR